MENIKQIGAVGGAVALLLCWPLAVGHIGHQVINHGLAEIDSNQISAEIITYDRGYLSSNVTTQFSVTDTSLKQQLISEGLPTQWLVESHIKHQLFSLAAESRLPEYPDLPITMQSQTRLNGNTDYSVQMDNWHFQSEGEQPFHLAVQPITLSGSISRAGELSYHLQLPSARINFIDGQTLQISEFVAQGYGHQEHNFWLGQQALKLANLTLFDDEDGVVFSANQGNYVFVSSLDESKQRFTGQHNLVIAELANEEGNIKQLTFDFSLADLDSQAFEQLSELYHDYADSPFDTLNRALPVMERLFAQGFSLNLNQLSAVVGEGEFNAKWLLSVPMGTDNILQDPTSILPALTGEVDNYISQQFAEDFPFIQMTMDELVMMEMATQDENGYYIKANLKQGDVLFSNGTQVALLSLLMPLFM